jgi:pyruvate dehydrogenase E2 component (dihydrolipoamide acetyltransferase)
MTTHLVDVTMPRLSDSMEEATVLQWLKRPGDDVRKGEPLVEVETDKATIVYEAELAGRVDEIVVDDGGTAALGAVIARVRVTGSALGIRPTAAPPASQPEIAIPASAAPAPTKSERQRATPVARRLAVEFGVSLAGVEGTGPGGRIVGGDVRAAAGGAGQTAAVSDAPSGRGSETQLPLTATARTIARRMVESRSQIPDFTLELEIDMEPAALLRSDLATAGTRSSFNDLVVRAVGLCLREFPALNASYVDGGVVRYSRINVGIAVATEHVLMVPTIFDADQKTIGEIAAESRALANRVRANAIELADLADGTFTVSNLGMFGIRRFQAVINAPQAGILAVGEVAPRPAVGTDGGLVVRRTMEVALSCDHRAVYGAEAARFLKRFSDVLEHPEQL